jgi:uncharacterized protein (TIGR00661 family)
MAGDSQSYIYVGGNAQGNGHINRLRRLVPALREEGANVKCLFSGRDLKGFFNMAVFGDDFEVRRGLEMGLTKEGRLSKKRTVLKNTPAMKEFRRDIRELDMEGCDLVVIDYEPILARAAERNGIPSIGVGNHYAFNHDVPRGKGHGKIVNRLMKKMAPADIELGMHFHHFGQPMITPIFDPPKGKDEKAPNKILVYLGFENPDSILKMIRGFNGWDFHVYHPSVKEVSVQDGHIFLNPPSAKFKEDLADCAGLIANAGFVTPAEALHLGIRMLLKPQDGQPEQASNARAIEELKWGSTMYTLDRNVLGQWLDGPPGVKIIYPDTAKAVADWIVNTDHSDVNSLVKKLWSQVKGVGAPNL